MNIKNIILATVISVLALNLSAINHKIEIDSNDLDWVNMKPVIDSDSIYEIAEVMPEFPGGHKAMMKFIQENIKYPKEAMKNNIEGRVFISFVVNENGKVTDVNPLLPPEKQLGNGMEEEAMRVLSLMPDWIPGQQMGKNVSVKYTLPFNFSLEKENKSKKKKQ